jgi:hypothetical protein
VILTLAWKEYREQRAIWLTMAVMTGVLGFGLAQLVAPEGTEAARTEISTLIILGLAATYGVVCGAMMFAGEHESGTMVLLDIFSGRRELLWLWKFLFGVVLSLSEALAVALVLHLLGQRIPGWLPILVGQSHSPRGFIDPSRMADALSTGIWFLVVPAVTLEAFAWGLLGSALSRRVLSGAALAAVMVAPLWLFTVFAPPPVFVGIRLAAAGVALFLSNVIFLTQPREPVLGPPPPLEPPEPLRKRLDQWEGGRKFELERRAPQLAGKDGSDLDIPVVMVEARPGRQVVRRRPPRVRPARSAGQVLWWLTLRQAAVPLAILAGVAVVVGFMVPAQGQVVWPVATLLLGVACGTAAFAPEQRDQSYQFLAAQHLPLRTVWNVKLIFWLAAAVLLALLLLAGGGILNLGKSLVALRPAPAGPAGGPLDVPPPEAADPAPGFRFGTLQHLFGPALFFGVWLAYGFAAGQLLVLYCRKAVLAVLLSVLVAFGALAAWMPSLLCGGLGRWQLWLAPLAALAATRLLFRAWAGGRIKERRPVAAMVGVALGLFVWAAGTFAFRAWEIPEVGEPVDREAFRMALPQGQKNLAGQKIQEAVEEVQRPGGREGPWLPAVEEAARLPLGMIESPLRYLPELRVLTDKLQGRAKDALGRGDPEQALEHFVQMLALSRNYRHKAPLALYLLGVEAEHKGLDFLDTWFAQRKPTPQMLRRIFDELNRHAGRTPPPLDCAQTECYRAGRLLANPPGWTFYSGTEGAGRIRERWLAGWIAASLDTPWEEERKIRLWQLVWAGLFRGAATPYWRLPQHSGNFDNVKPATRQVLMGWLPAAEGPGSSVTVDRLARLLDGSWLADEQLFTLVVPLRAAATQARWRVEAHRLALALALYRLKEGKPAARLDDLVPSYLPKLPLDPYSGRAFRYRVSQGEVLHFADADEDFQGRGGRDKGVVRAGQGIVWSTGPDRADNGGRRHGGRLPDHDPRWAGEGFDLVTLVPHWP